MLYNQLAAPAPDPTLAENWIKPKGNLDPARLGNIVTALTCGCVVATDGSFVLEGCEEYIELILAGDFRSARAHFVKEEKVA